MLLVGWVDEERGLYNLNEKETNLKCSSFGVSLSIRLAQFGNK